MSPETNPVLDASPKMQADYAYRLSIAQYLLGEQILGQYGVRSMPTTHDSLDEAYKAIITARATFIPELRHKVYLDRALERRGANCIASAVAGCALALMMKRPTIEPVFIISSGTGRALITAEEAGQEVIYRLSQSDRNIRGVSEYRREARPVDMLIAQAHRQPVNGIRAFFEWKQSGFSPRELRRIGDSELGPHGFPPKSPDAMLTVSGAYLPALGDATAHWYTVKKSKFIEDSRALAAVPDELRAHLPWDKVSSVQA